jgi:uncharacterized ferritin-like protein (DUF455 family)
MTTRFEAAYACLTENQVDRKLALTAQVLAEWPRLALDDFPPPQAIADPGRPARPELVSPRQVSRRPVTSIEGRAALLHAVAHIEFNAINLAWDAVYRFRGLPPEYYADWAGIAGEEARHFAMVREYLRELGYDYGDFPAHNGLWEMAVETACDPLVRMALVPRVLEARGLDATPRIQAKLRQVNDERAIAILEVILRDEIGHVATGNRWFRYLCAERGVEPESEFMALLRRHLRGNLKPPFHREARLAAGFSASELDALEQFGRVKTG